MLYCLVTKQIGALVTQKDNMELGWAFERAFHKYAAYENQPRDFGVGFPLTQSEIHAIAVVCENEGISLGELAKERAVTKGAMSQLVSRLVAKGLLVKETAEHSASYVSLRPTDLGRKANENHSRAHASMGMTIDQQLFSDMSEEEIRRITKKFNLFSDLIDAEMGVTDA